MLGFVDVCMLGCEGTECKQILEISDIKYKYRKWLIKFGGIGEMDKTELKYYFSITFTTI